MTISQLIERQNREGVISLIRQGLFYRGYEQGAVLLHSLFDWQVKSRPLKSCGGEVLCYVGFPAPSLQRVLERITVLGGTVDVLEDGKQIEIIGLNIDFDRQALQMAATPGVSRRGKIMEADGAPHDRDELLLRLQSFDITGCTPIECMNFLAEIQRQLSAQTLRQ